MTHCEIYVCVWNLTSKIAVDLTDIFSSYQSLQTSDVIVDLKERKFDAAIFLNDWVYELSIGKHMYIYKHCKA